MSKSVMSVLYILMLFILWLCLLCYYIYNIIQATEIAYYEPVHCINRSCNLKVAAHLFMTLLDGMKILLSE